MRTELANRKIATGNHEGIRDIVLYSDLNLVRPGIEVRHRNLLDKIHLQRSVRGVRRLTYNLFNFLAVPSNEHFCADRWLLGLFVEFQIVNLQEDIQILVPFKLILDAWTHLQAADLELSRDRARRKVVDDIGQDQGTGRKVVFRKTSYIEGLVDRSFILRARVLNDDE